MKLPLRGEWAIKPCVRCGKTGKNFSKLVDSTYYSIKCDSCTNIVYVWRQTSKQAIISWNREKVGSL